MGALPADWNQGDDVYCLYYKHASSLGALYTVKCIVMDDMLLVGARPHRSWLRKFALIWNDPSILFDSSTKQAC
jgi:hypothetical protein